MSASKFVDRPLLRKGSKYDYEAIIATAENGKAVRIELKNVNNRGGTISSISSVLARRGYKIHTTMKTGELVVWCEKQVTA